MPHDDYHLHTTGAVHRPTSTRSGVEHQRGEERRRTGGRIRLRRQWLCRDMTERSSLELITAHVADLGHGIFVWH